MAKARKAKSASTGRTVATSGSTGSTRNNGGSARGGSPTERFRALEQANRTWHSRVEKTLKRARKAAGN